MYKTGQFEWYLLTTPLKFKELSADPANSAVPANIVSLYAKDKAGTSNLYFKDDAHNVHDLGLLPASAQALTRVNDTNVTLTLGGSPTTALLAATSLTLGWTGQLAETRGGTNQSTYVTGDILYASASNTLSKLAGNTTTTRKFLRQTGTGAASQAPAWDTIVAADVPGSALTKTDDTNVTLTLGGSASTALLNAASLTLGWTGTLGVSRGGTGTGTAFTQGSVVFAGASGVYSQDNSGLFYDASNIRLGVNTATPLAKLHTEETLTTSPRCWVNDQYSNTAGGALFIGRKSRGTTAGTAGQVLTNDVICGFTSAGNDGTNFGTGVAFLRTVATENFTSTAQGTKVQMQTVATGSLTSAVVLELGSDAGVVLPQTTSYLDLTAISAGNPNLKVTATSDTPATTWTAGTPSNNPAGFIEIVAGGSARYIPFWT